MQKDGQNNITLRVGPPKPPYCKGELYTVQDGDTLYFIALRFGISLDDLIKANPQIPNPNIIYPGQVICIPLKPIEDTVIYSTGPLAIDVIQRYIGVVVENNSKRLIKYNIKVYNKDECPKILVFKLFNKIQPWCTIPTLIDLKEINSFFYEVQIEAPNFPQVLVTVYALTKSFRIVAGNTLRHSELTLLSRKDVKDAPVGNKRTKNEDIINWNTVSAK